MARLPDRWEDLDPALQDMVINVLEAHEKHAIFIFRNMKDALVEKVKANAYKLGADRLREQQMMKVTKNPDDIPFLGGCAEADHRYHREQSLDGKGPALRRLAESIDTPEEMVAVLAGMDLQLDPSHATPEWKNLMWADLYERCRRIPGVPKDLAAEGIVSLVETEATTIVMNRLKNAPTPELKRLARQQLELVKMCLGKRYLGPEVG